MMEAKGSFASPALVIAHPGHELRLHGWLERARPLVFVLTDGSGSTGHSRLSSTVQLLTRAGASGGGIFGRFTDREVYTLLLERRLEVFLGLASELAGCLVRAGIDYVVGDASEGYNPTHDVCRLVIDAAVALTGRTTARQVGNYDFALAGRPDDCPEALRCRAVRVCLDDAAFRRKWAAAAAYPEMAVEVASAVRSWGREAFRVEWLRPAAPLAAPPSAEHSPFYEQHGQRRVAAGLYRQVLRYRDHILPLAQALRDLAQRRCA
jgi:hypothetical protein